MDATDNSFAKHDFLRSLGSSINSHQTNKQLKEIFKSAFITNCTLDDASVTEEELQILEDLDEEEIINNLKSLVDNLLNFKLNCKSHDSGELATRCDQIEKLLQKQEAEVRNHIKIEHQLKLYIDTLQQKLAETEKSFSEAQASIKEMEGRGLETMQTKLKKVEMRFQSELNRVIKEYREDAYNQAKNNEKIKRFEEIIEKKEKAYVKLLSDYTKLKQKLEETIRGSSDRARSERRCIKARSGSDGGIKLRKRYKS